MVLALVDKITNMQAYLSFENKRGVGLTTDEMRKKVLTHLRTSELANRLAKEPTDNEMMRSSFKTLPQRFQEEIQSPDWVYYPKVEEGVKRVLSIFDLFADRYQTSEEQRKAILETAVIETIAQGSFAMAQAIVDKHGIKYDLQINSEVLAKAKPLCTKSWQKELIDKYQGLESLGDFLDTIPELQLDLDEHSLGLTKPLSRMRSSLYGRYDSYPFNHPTDRVYPFQLIEIQVGDKTFVRTYGIGDIGHIPMIDFEESRRQAGVSGYKKVIVGASHAIIGHGQIIVASGNRFYGSKHFGHIKNFERVKNILAQSEERVLGVKMSDYNFKVKRYKD